MGKPTAIQHPRTGEVMVLSVPDAATENALPREMQWLLDFADALAAKDKELAEAREALKRCYTQPAITVYILRNWDRTHIVAFAKHLLGDGCQACHGPAAREAGEVGP